MKIAAIEDGGQICSVFDSGDVAVYSDDTGVWAEERRFKNIVQVAEGIAGIRTALINLANELKTVKIIVAGEISGIAFSIFEGAGFEIFTAHTKVADVLDFVKNEMEETARGHRENRSANIQLYLKRGMNRGDFFLNLQEMLAENPQATTKSILLPFLREGDFTRLDIVCGHIPPWFDRELGQLGLAFETVGVLPDKKTVRIFHTKAGEAAL